MGLSSPLDKIALISLGLTSLYIPVLILTALCSAVCGGKNKSGAREMLLARQAAAPAAMSQQDLLKMQNALKTLAELQKSVQILE